MTDNRKYTHMQILVNVGKMADKLKVHVQYMAERLKYVVNF
jgi:hypothetical protein